MGAKKAKTSRKKKKAASTLLPVKPGPKKPVPPKKSLPDDDWEHIELWQRVAKALFALPAHFVSETRIDGINVTDAFTLGAALTASIEEQSVRTLNEMRDFWDPHGKYQDAFFIRQSQTFPDVLMIRGSDEILFGIELKGWYLLAKEGEPSYRFSTTAKACAAPDLIFVIPWSLSNVLSGQPRTYKPFVEVAGYVADMRNYYWEYDRKTKADTGIRIAEDGVTPYPKKSDKIHDKPKHDEGGNFGRIARYGIMDEFISTALEIQLRGVAAKEWIKFLKTITEGAQKQQNMK